MGYFLTCNLHRIGLDDHMKDGEMVGECSMDGRDEKYMKILM